MDVFKGVADFCASERKGWLEKLAEAIRRAFDNSISLPAIKPGNQHPERPGSPKFALSAQVTPIIRVAQLGKVIASEMPAAGFQPSILIDPLELLSQPRLRQTR